MSLISTHSYRPVFLSVTAVYTFCFCVTDQSTFNRFNFLCVVSLYSFLQIRLSLCRFTLLILTDPTFSVSFHSTHSYRSDFLCVVSLYSFLLIRLSLCRFTLLILTDPSFSLHILTNPSFTESLRNVHSCTLHILTGPSFSVLLEP